MVRLRSALLLRLSVRLLFLVALVAASNSYAVGLASLHQLYKSASQALSNGDQATFAATKSKLTDYPLYPDLLLRDLSRRLGSANISAEVHDFLQRYDDTPLAPRLRDNWLRHLAKRQRWAAFLQDYQVSIEHSVALDCLRRQALINSGQAETALSDIESVWLVGKSLPDSCNPVFKVWRQRGGMTAAHIWQRFELALRANQVGLANYLRSRMSKSQQKQAKQWLAVHKQPKLALSVKRFKPSNPQAAGAVLHGLWRWSRDDSVAAAKAFDKLNKRFRFKPSSALTALQKRLAVYLAGRDHPSAPNRLAHLPESAVDESVEEWRVRVMLKNRDWQGVLDWIDRMSPAVQQKLAWRYWQARALQANGRQAEAAKVFTQLAGQRDYYGFLAADRIGQEYRMNHEPVALTGAGLPSVTETTGVRRIKEMKRLGRVSKARVEWKHTMRRLEPQQVQTAAKIVSDWAWYDVAIATLAQADHWNDLELRFPTPHRDKVRRYAKVSGVDPAWMFAVMRQESLFHPGAQSGAGALGLMQIMPGTGRQIASQLKTRFPGKKGLLKADVNIRFGSYYLRNVMRSLQGNPMLATAAYNAGPTRVRKWLPASSAIDADIWAETIPYSETRSYVRRVLEYATVYAWRLDLPQIPLSQRMAQVLPLK